MRFSGSLQRCARLLVGACALLALRPVAVAQVKHTPQPEDVLPESELDDPIGLDADSRSLGSAAPAAPSKPDAAAGRAERDRFGPEPPPLSVRSGEVLTALPAVRESAHRVRVELAAGATEVAVEIELTSLAARPAEVRYRLALPDQSALLALEVCLATVCRNGLPSDRENDAGGRAYDAAVLARPSAEGQPLRPIAHATAIHDARGDALVLRAAPVRKGAPLTLRVRYRTACPVHGGMLRLQLPARGMDPQAAPTELLVEPAKSLLDVRIGRDPVTRTAATLDPWAAAELSARVSSSARTVGASELVRCGDHDCARIWAFGPSAAARAVDMVLALDVSPSMEGPARSRLLSTVAALLSAAPAESRVRVLAFAARAEPLVVDALPTDQVALAPLQNAIESAELGSATRFEAIWSLASDWLGRGQRSRGKQPLIVIVGDGGLTLGDTRAFEHARAAGVEVSSVNTSDRPTGNALRSAVQRGTGIAIDVGAAADLSARGGDPARLEERLDALFARTLVPRVRAVIDGKTRELGPLRAGDTLSFDGPARTPPALLLGARRLQARGKASIGRALGAVDARDLLARDDDFPKAGAKHCDARGPARRHSGISSDASPVALAEAHSCRAAPKPSAPVSEIGIGMPSDPLLDMLRRRVMPVARGCFRRDRAGRPDYAKRAVFAFTLAEREVTDARIEGSIPEALRTCLLTAVDTLEVPRFSGAVTVRYPLVTESLPRPEQVELRGATAATLDHMFGTE